MIFVNLASVAPPSIALPLLPNAPTHYITRHRTGLCTCAQRMLCYFALIPISVLFVPPSRKEKSFSFSWLSVDPLGLCFLFSLSIVFIAVYGFTLGNGL